MSRRIQVFWPGDAPLGSDLERVSPEELLRSPPSGDVILFLETDDFANALGRMTAIRQLPDPVSYLVPVILVHDQAHTPAMLSALGDAVTSRARLGEELENLTRDVAPIHLWLGNLPADTGADEQLSVRLLRHLASRDTQAIPQASEQFPSGHIYPALMPYFGGADGGIFETLAFLEQEHFLSSEFRARAHFCFHCDSAFLNFEETCVQCESADLESLELVHHFRCGHVAPLEEYRQGDDLRCGKCGKELRHIGVDYDKPSTMYRCNQCDHRMQEVNVRSSCYRCERKASPENQRSRRIASYSLTPLGANGARFGVASLFTNILERDVGLVPFSVFERMVELEKARISRFARNESSLMLVAFDGIERIYTQLGSRAPQVFEALGTVFSQVLRNTDVVSTRNDSLYVVLLTETAGDDAEIPRGRLVERLNETLRANIKEPPEVQAGLVAVAKDLDLTRELNAAIIDGS